MKGKYRLQEFHDQKQFYQLQILPQIFADSRLHGITLKRRVFLTRRVFRLLLLEKISQNWKQKLKRQNFMHLDQMYLHFRLMPSLTAILTKKVLI